MIPLHKLEKLPRHQRLRKISKVFTLAENRLCAAIVTANEANSPNQSASTANSPIFSAVECEFFAGIAELLIRDGAFQPEALEAFTKAALVFSRAAPPFHQHAPPHPACGNRPQSGGLGFY